MGIGILGWDWIPKAMEFSIPSRWGGILNSIKKGIWHLPFYPSTATAASLATAFSSATTASPARSGQCRLSGPAPTTTASPVQLRPPPLRPPLRPPVARHPPSRRAVISFCISEIKFIWNICEPNRLWNWISIPFPANQTDYGIGFQFLTDSNSNSNSIRNIPANQTDPNNYFVLDSDNNDRIIRDTCIWLPFKHVK